MQEDSLIKREKFAIALRKDKRSQILASKRSSLFSKMKIKMAQQEEAKTTSTPDHFSILSQGRKPDALINRIGDEFGFEKQIEYKV